MRVETIGSARLYLGDCREVLPSLSKVDAVVTDPPYGVAGGWGSGLRKGGGKSRSRRAKTAYTAFEDTPAYVAGVVVPVILDCISITASGAVTPGIRHHRLYPEPAHVGSFQYPGSTVMSCWGPVLWQPVLFYGRDPHQGRLVPDSRPNCNDVDLDTDHPCPKPLKQWTWLVQRASAFGSVVLDPFMGSGTTGVACARLGRSFIGIEIDEKYFDTACRRVEQAQRQSDLFVQPAPAATQLSMADRYTAPLPLQDHRSVA